MAWQEEYTVSPRMRGITKQYRVLDSRNLDKSNVSSNLNLRSDVGSKELSGPVGVAANDVSWSLVLACFVSTCPNIT